MGWELSRPKCRLAPTVKHTGCVIPYTVPRTPYRGFAANDESVIIRPIVGVIVVVKNCFYKTNVSTLEQML